MVVPPAGGHFEYFDSVAGEAIDARNTDQVVEFISRLKSDFALWKQYSDNAIALVDDYSAAAFQRRVDQLWEPPLGCLRLLGSMMNY